MLLGFLSYKIPLYLKVADANLVKVRLFWYVCVCVLMRT